jgi:hypothetical protein
MLVEHDGSIYGRALDTTGFPLSFDTRDFPSTFEAASFTRLLGAGASTPDFDGGVQTRFGFAGGNESSNTLTQSYDNRALPVVVADKAREPRRRGGPRSAHIDRDPAVPRPAQEAERAGRCLGARYFTESGHGWAKVPVVR